MNCRNSVPRITVAVLIAGLFIYPFSLKSQEIPTLLSDTITQAPKTIKLSEISIKSTQVISYTNQAMENLISDEEIDRIRRINDSILFSIDSLLSNERSNNFDNNSIRQLTNKAAFWRQKLLIVEKEKASLSSKIQTIEEERFKLKKEQELWSNTKESLIQEESFRSLQARINELIAFLESTENNIRQRSEKLLLMLDKTSELSFSISKHIGLMEKTLLSNESQVFTKHHKAIYEIDWKNPNNWNPMPSLKSLKYEEIKPLLEYLRMNLSRNFFLLLIIVVLIITFRSLKSRIIDTGKKKNSFLGKQISKIFFKPSLIAIVLGLFSTVIIMPNPPELYGDIIQTMVIIPLYYVVYLLLNQKFARQLFMIGCLTVLHVTIYVFPPDHLLFRMILFFLIMAELGMLWSFINYLSKHPLSNALLDKSLLLLLYFNSIMVIIGFVGAITGATLLAVEAVIVPVFGVFAAMLLIVSAISIGGLIEIVIDSPRANNLSFIKKYGEDIKSRLVRIINTGAVIYWLIVLLRSLRLDRNVIDAVGGFVKKDMHIGSANFSLGDILIFIIVIYLSVLLSRILQVILEKDILNKFNLKKGIPYTVGLMIRYTVITLGIFLAITAAGMPVGSLGILIGAMGVGIGFGLQNVFNNLVSGLILLFERPIQIGDTIKVGELTGKVKSIGIRSSNVRTFDGAEVIVPNGQLISKEVINWTLSDQYRRIEVFAGVAYGSDPHLVRKVILEGLAKHPDIIDKPDPDVFFIEMGDSSLNFRILFWTGQIGEWLRIQSEVVYMVHDLMKENGIEIPFPQRDLHIKSIEQGIEVKDTRKK